MTAQMTFIWIGELKKSHFQEPVALYWKRLQHYYRVHEICLKDASGRLSPEQRRDKESTAVEDRLGNRDAPICLDQRGRSFSSEAFAEQLSSWLQDGSMRPCFIIGGAFGLSPQLLGKARLCLSLSPLTFPHELARLILLEQVYRAATILHNHPYHH